MAARFVLFGIVVVMLFVGGYMLISYIVSAKVRKKLGDIDHKVTMGNIKTDKYLNELEKEEQKSVKNK